jgi:hypothetical protein
VDAAILRSDLYEFCDVLVQRGFLENAPAP